MKEVVSLDAPKLFSTMSRHKLVKALDLDDELDDFDGGAESDTDDGVSAEDRGALVLRYNISDWMNLVKS